MIYWGFVIGTMIFVFLAAAFGMKTIYLSILGCLASYAWFLHASGPFRDSQSFSLAAGYGVMFLIFATPGIVLSAVAGQSAFKLLKARRA